MILVFVIIEHDETRHGLSDAPVVIFHWNMKTVKTTEI